MAELTQLLLKCCWLLRASSIRAFDVVKRQNILLDRQNMILHDSLMLRVIGVHGQVLLRRQLDQQPVRVIGARREVCAHRNLLDDRDLAL